MTRRVMADNDVCVRHLDNRQRALQHVARISSVQAHAARLRPPGIRFAGQPLAVQHEETRSVGRENMTDVGYQPTGTHPSTVLRSPFDTSTTATVLLSALATSSLVPSGDSARLFGVVPTGAFGYNATEICSFADRDARSTTQTAFVFAHATNSRVPSFDWSIAFGWGPTAISPSGCQRVRRKHQDLSTTPQRDEQRAAVG